MQCFMLTAAGWEPIPADRLTGETEKRDEKRAYMRAYMREWRKTHPLNAEQRRKDNCRSYAKEYLKRGHLTREPCLICDDADAQMHHPDYAEPLNVVWLCRKHHLTIHKLGLA